MASRIRYLRIRAVVAAVVATLALPAARAETARTGDEPWYRMRALETQRLAQIETDREEPGAEIKLDGEQWLRGVGRRSTLVLPGEHYIAASKPGYFPVTRPVYVKAGQQARVALPMNEDRLVETRRWSASILSPHRAEVSALSALVRF